MGKIDFRQIPLTWRVPGTHVEFDWSKAQQGLQLDMERILVFAHKLAAGTADADTPVQVLSADHGVQLAGRGSMGAAMLKAAKDNNTVTEMWAVFVAEPAAGVAATGAFTFAGPATAAGTHPLLIAGKLVQVGVASGDSAAAQATAAAAAINADLDLPVTAAVDGVDTTKVNLTCRWKGETGNRIDLRVGYYRGLASPAGAAVTVTVMSGGTGVPDLTAALDALADIHYHHVFCPWMDAVTVATLSDWMEDRWHAMVQREGILWCAATGTHGTLTTLGTSLNSDVLSVAGLGKSPTPDYVAAAAYGAAAAYRLGIDPSRQLRSVELEGVLPPEATDRFDDDERNLLLYKGISTMVATVDGRTLIERAITTRQTNEFGLPDASRLDVMTVATASAMRRTLRNYVSTRFPDYKLADDGINFGPGQAIITPSLFRGHVINLARMWEAQGWVEAVDSWKDGIVCTRPKDTDVNRLDTLLPPDIINNAMVFAFLVQPRL